MAGVEFSSGMGRAWAASAAEDNIGKSLGELSTPCAILDLAVIRRNCAQMSNMCNKVGVEFRAHVKTHKTVQGTIWQTGGPNSTSPVNLIASTTLEIQNLVPWLSAQQKAGRPVNILYGVPLPPSSIPTLIRLRNAITEPYCITVMIDHPSQLDALRGKDLCPRAFIKIDTGYGRAGIPHSADSDVLRALLARMKQAHDAGDVRFLGFYSHSGDSYGVSSFGEALQILGRELTGLGEAAKLARAAGVHAGHDQAQSYVLSIGATPTISAAWMNADPKAQDGEVPGIIAGLKKDGHVVEFHAGNYPILDLQQLATSAGASSTTPLPDASDCPARSPADIAMTILAEINSSYPERSPPECLVTTGCLALAREPCKSYDGWGVLADWKAGEASGASAGGIQHGSGWYVHAISQEHGRIKVGDVPGVATAKEGVAREWKVGDKVRVWPNHACITAANFPYFVVVDGQDESGGEKVVDVWARCIGW